MPNHLWVIPILCLAVFLTACGRKEAPQIVAGSPPEIAALTHEISGNSLKLDLRLAGGEEGVGYQIDRAEMDPFCKCPGMWRRYYELPPHSSHANKPLTRLINLRSSKQEYFFRIRAVDGLGRLGPWSKPIHARAEALPE